jgi:hypothetical protein
MADEQGATGGEIQIPGTKKKVPTVVVLGVAAAGALVLYLVTKNSATNTGGGGNALTPSDNGPGGGSTAPDLSALQQQLADITRAQKEGFVNLQTEVSQLQQGISSINIPAQIPAYNPAGGGGMVYPGYAYPVENPSIPAGGVNLSAVNLPIDQVGGRASTIATKAAPAGQTGDRPSAAVKAPSTSGTVGEKASTGTKAAPAAPKASAGTTGGKASTGTKEAPAAAKTPVVNSASKVGARRY